MAADTEETTINQNQPIQAVAIKPPNFIESNVIAWFAIMEAQFNIANIRQTSQKFFNTLAALPVDIEGNIQPTILQSKDYDALKEAVTGAYEKTKPEMLDKLMSSSTVTGRPSVYLNELMSLASRIGVGDDIVRHKFIQALPHSIKPVVAAQVDLDTDRLGKMADDLLLYFNKQDTAHIRQISGKQKDEQQNKNETKRIHGCSHSENKFSTSVRPFNKDQKPQICRAHLYFAERAKFCKPWCRWPNKRNVQMQPNSRPNSPFPRETSEN